MALFSKTAKSQGLSFSKLGARGQALLSKIPETEILAIVDTKTFVDGQSKAFHALLHIAESARVLSISNANVSEYSGKAYLAAFSPPLLRLKFIEKYLEPKGPHFEAAQKFGIGPLVEESKNLAEETIKLILEEAHRAIAATGSNGRITSASGHISALGLAKVSPKAHKFIELSLKPEEILESISSQQLEFTRIPPESKGVEAMRFLIMQTDMERVVAFAQDHLTNLAVYFTLAHLAGLENDASFLNNIAQTQKFLKSLADHSANIASLTKSARLSEIARETKNVIEQILKNLAASM